MKRKPKVAVDAQQCFSIIKELWMRLELGNYCFYCWRCAKKFTKSSVAHYDGKCLCHHGCNRTIRPDFTVSCDPDEPRFYKTKRKGRPPNDFFYNGWHPNEKPIAYKSDRFYDGLMEDEERKLIALTVDKAEAGR